MAVGGQRHAPAVLPPGKNPVPSVREAGWTPGPVWTDAGNLSPHPGFDPRTRPDRSQSLYRLSYYTAIIPLLRHKNETLKGLYTLSCV
jgi:hypothetical protein